MELLRPLFSYLEKQWIKNRLFRPIRWSQYMQFMRTNNDCEGWHYRLNAMFKATPDIFKLVKLLLGEAKLIPVQVKRNILSFANLHS